MRILSAILAFQLLGSLASASVPSASPRSNEAVIADAVCPLPATEPLRIIEKSIIVDRAPEDVYAFWRDLTHVPEFMERVESVEIVDAELSRWNIKAPLGVHLHWTVQILSESAPHDLALRRKRCFFGDRKEAVVARLKDLSSFESPPCHPEIRRRI